MKYWYDYVKLHIQGNSIIRINQTTNFKMISKMIEQFNCLLSLSSSWLQSLNSSSFSATLMYSSTLGSTSSMGSFTTSLKSTASAHTLGLAISVVCVSSQIYFFGLGMCSCMFYFGAYP